MVIALLTSESQIVDRGRAVFAKRDDVLDGETRNRKPFRALAIFAFSIGPLRDLLSDFGGIRSHLIGKDLQFLTEGRKFNAA